MARPPSVEEEQKKAAARELLEGDRAALMLQQPFVALLLMHVEIVVVADHRLSLAMTDGERLFLSAPAVLTLDEGQRTFLLAHLVWHVALGHRRREAYGRDELASKSWDLAIDHEVNGLLASLGIDVPDDAPLFVGREGQSAEALVTELRASPRWAQRWLADGRGELADLHRAPLGEQTSDDTPPSETEVVDPAFAPRQDPREGEPWTERILAAAQQLERRGQELPMALQAFVEELRRPQLPWSQLLARFVVSVVGGRRSWLPPSRRHVHRGLYLPSHRETLLRVTVAIDTSASTQRVMPRFLSALLGVVGAYGRYELTLLSCDDELRLEGRYSSERPLDLENLDLVGLGATDLRPIFTHVHGHPPAPALLIVLSDGFGEVPAREPPYPVLWVLPRGGRRPCSWGQVLRLD